MDEQSVEQLISSILQGQGDGNALRQIAPPQWQQIDQLLTKNPTRQLIYFILKRKDCLEILPPAIKEKWQATYYYNLQRNILAIEQLKEIRDVFAGAGIEFILLKGLSLNFTVYNDLGARSSMDIDLLVKKEQLQQARYQLERLGYHLQSGARTDLLENFGCGDWVF